MEQQGEYPIAASREQVWSALNDAETLAECIPGCQSMAQTSDTEFTAKVKAKVGPVSATFDAEIALSDLQPPESYTLAGSVKGGAAGFGKGQASVQLAEAEGGTLLTYQVTASVGGKLAQIGSRLVDGAARKMADDFFANFQQKLNPVDPEAAEDAGAAEAGTDKQQTAKQQTERHYEPSGNNYVWIAAFVVLALAMILAI